jgi:hypothetical protein
MSFYYLSFFAYLIFQATFQAISLFSFIFYIDFIALQFFQILYCLPFQAFITKTMMDSKYF